MLAERLRGLVCCAQTDWPVLKAGPTSWRSKIARLCRGTGWKLVARADGARGSVAVACDCGMEERAGRVMERARIPKRYEHCDFESYVTDLDTARGPPNMQTR